MVQLLDRGATIPPRMLATAAARARAPVVEVLVQHGADVNAAAYPSYPKMPLYDPPEDLPPLLAAAGSLDGCLECIQLLLAHGADPNLHDRAGRTALMIAVGKGNAAVIPTLVGAGADPNAQDIDGHTVLMYAVMPMEGRLGYLVDPRKRAAAGSLDDGCLECIQSLLAHGADPNLHDRAGRTALLIAAGKGNATMIPTLVAAWADPNAQDIDGRTVLMYAVMPMEGYLADWRKESVMSALLDSELLKDRVQINARDHGGRTVLAYAHQYNQGATVVLEKHGAIE